MLTIGNFARLAGVSVRTLHHYEKVQLLMPAHIDADTGYRGYRSAQLPRIHRIVALKELGLSLTQIRPLLDDLSADQLAEMLLMKRQELEREVTNRQLQLTRVEHRLKYIELENDMTIDIVLKELEPLRVAQIRRTGDDGIDFYSVSHFARPAFEALFHDLDKNGVTAQGAPFLYYEPVDDTSSTPLAAVPIGEQPFEASGDVTVTTLDATTVASTIYQGQPDHDAIGPIYGRLVQFANDNGYQPRGPGRDVIVGESDDDMILELQLPLEAV